MQVGNLVKIKRASIGLPKGSIGLVVRHFAQPLYSQEYAGPQPLYSLFEIQFTNGRTVRLLSRDLEVISGTA